LEGLEIEERIDALTNEDVKRANNIKNIALDAVDIGVETVVKLDDQGQQLRHVQEDLQDIRINVRAAKYDTSKLGWCGCWYQCCHKRILSSQSLNTAAATSDPNEAVTAQPQPQGPITKSILKDDPREQQIEEDLQ